MREWSQRIAGLSVALAFGIFFQLFGFEKVDAAVEVPQAYVFSSSAVTAKQAQMRKTFPAAVCKGRVPVNLVAGGMGYVFVYCVDELNGPVQIWFHINSKGNVIRSSSAPDLGP